MTGSNNSDTGVVLSIVSEEKTGAPTGPGPIRVLSAAEWVAKHRPLSYLVDGICLEGYFYGMTGPTGHLKTSVALEMARCIAFDTPFCGYEIGSPEIRAALLGRSDAIDTLADICAGRQVLVSGPTGKEHWRRPTMPERLQALQLVLKKVVPDLQSTELTGADGADLFGKEPEAVDSRQLARVVLEILSSAVPEGGKVTVEDADTHVARFHDPDLGKKIMPDTSDMVGGNKPAASLNGEGDTQTPIGSVEEVGEAGHCISLREIDSGGRKRWFIYDEHGNHVSAAWGRDEARRQCQQLIREGRISK